jgi:hypothetical protein
VKVVVAVPFQELPGDSRVIDEGPDELVHAPGQGGAGIGHPVAHGVAEPDLDIDARFLPELHQFDGEGDTETVDVRPGDVFEVAPRLDPRVEVGLHDAQVAVHGLSPRLIELQEDVVIRHGGQDSRLLRPACFTRWTSSMAARIHPVTSGR